MGSRRRRRLSAVSAAAILVLLRLAAAAFEPATNVLLNCGSTDSATPPDDGRAFLPDSAAAISGDSAAASGGGPAALYRTARVTSSSFSYEIPISAAGVTVLRLHFFPFGDLLYSAIRVSAGGVLLLDRFSPPAGGAIKEFFLGPGGAALTVTIAAAAPPSPAFLSAAEVFSAPAELLRGDGRWSGLGPAQALETVHRVNMGGPLVTPFNDSLWRTWVPDGGFLLTPAVAARLATSAAVAYPGGAAGPTPEVAPAAVYASLVHMNRAGLADPQINITWRLAVAGGAVHLVRLHFCDVLSNVTSDLLFNAYLDGNDFSRDLRPADLVNDVPLVPFYVQSVIPAAPSGAMLVTVGRSQRSSPAAADAILNALEIFKLVNGSVPSSSSSKGPSSSAAVIGGATAAAAVLLLSAAAFLLLRRRRRRRTTPPAADWWPMSTTTGGAGGESVGLVIPLEQVRAATNGFDEGLEVGSGGFGKVYRGTLADGTAVAVKRATAGSSQGYPEFQAEVLLLSKIRHRHLVSLVGYCDEGGEMILVYEFMAGGTLKELLHSGAAAAPPWARRLEICIGAARGVHYLHTGDARPIIHRDLKTSNILLDGEMVAKVSDFGLSRVGPDPGVTHVSTAVKGSFGYMDPEYFRTQQLTDKSDVYSFGVVLLEALCGRAVIEPERAGEELNLAEWAVACQRRGELGRVVDRRLAAEPGVSAASLGKFAETAVRCLAPYGEDRPAIGDVLWNLEYCLQLQRSGEAAAERRPFEDSAAGQDTFAAVMAERRLGEVAEEDEAAAIAGGRVDSAAGDAFSLLFSREGR